MHEESSTSAKITVFISHRESVCDECGNKLGSTAWITLQRDKGALCLSCADLDHLEFLASGDAALTRRRSSTAKSSSDEAVHLAVIANIRHTETDYDRLLSRGYDRSDARMSVAGEIERVIGKWKVAADQDASTHK